MKQRSQQRTVHAAERRRAMHARERGRALHARERGRALHARERGRALHARERGRALHARERGRGLRLWVIGCAVSCVLSLCALPAPAAAQGPRTQGFVVGLAFEGMRSAADTLPDADGIGGGALIGVSLTRRIVFTFGAGLGTGGGRLLGYAGFAARYYVPVWTLVAAYAEAGFMSHGRELEGDSLALGTGLSVGVGSEIFLQPHRSFFVAINRWGGRFDEIAYSSRQLAVSANLVRVSIGMQLRPRACGTRTTPPCPDPRR